MLENVLSVQNIPLTFSLMYYPLPQLRLLLSLILPFTAPFFSLFCWEKTIVTMNIKLPVLLLFEAYISNSQICFLISAKTSNLSVLFIKLLYTDILYTIQHSQTPFCQPVFQTQTFSTFLCLLP